MEYIIIIAPVVLLLWFLSVQGKKQRAAAEKNRNEALQEGNRVITIGGFIGTVVAVDEHTVVLQDVSGNLTEWIKTAVRGLYEELPNESEEAEEVEDAESVIDGKEDDLSYSDSQSYLTDRTEKGSERD